MRKDPRRDGSGSTLRCRRQKEHPGIPGSQAQRRSRPQDRPFGIHGTWDRTGPGADPGCTPSIPGSRAYLDPSASGSQVFPGLGSGAPGNRALVRVPPEAALARYNNTCCGKLRLPGLRFSRGPGNRRPGNRSNIPRKPSEENIKTSGRTIPSEETPTKMARSRVALIKVRAGKKLGNLESAVAFLVLLSTPLMSDSKTKRPGWATAWGTRSRVPGQGETGRTGRR